MTNVYNLNNYKIEFESVKWSPKW